MLDFLLGSRIQHMFLNHGCDVIVTLIFMNSKVGSDLQSVPFRTPGLDEKTKFMRLSNY